jgi:hypothetical protein
MPQMRWISAVDWNNRLESSDIGDTVGQHLIIGFRHKYLPMQSVSSWAVLPTSQIQALTRVWVHAVANKTSRRHWEVSMPQSHCSFYLYWIQIFIASYSMKRTFPAQDLISGGVICETTTWRGHFLLLFRITWSCLLMQGWNVKFWLWFIKRRAVKTCGNGDIALLSSFVCCVLFECGVLFCVMCVICVLCHRVKSICSLNK